MTRLGPRVLVAIVAALLLAGCAFGPAPQLAGKQYVSVSVTDGGAVRALVPGTVIRLRFDETDLRANAGCNHLGASYRIDGGRLLVDQLGTTDMGCDPDLMAQDAWLAEVLGASPSISIAGSDLRIEAGSVVITLRDREVVEPDANLVGPTWVLESILEGDAVASVPGDIEATITFLEDGSLELNAGCNRGGGTWQSVAGGIEVGPLMLTKMACDKDGATVEGAVLAVLEAGTISASIDSTLLTLQAGNRGIMLRAR